MGFARSCSDGNLPPLAEGNTPGDTLDVAIVYGPLSYYVYDDTLGGINFDLLRQFSADSGTPVKFWPVVSFSESISKLEKGVFDVYASVASDYSIKQRFFTTESIFLDRLVLVQLMDSTGKSKINSALDLANDTVYVSAESPAIQRLVNLSKEIGDSIFIKADPSLSEEYLCMKVATGDIKLAVVNENTAAGLQANYPLLSFDTPVSFTQFQVWIAPKNDSVNILKINDWFDTFKQTSRYREIIDKYQ